jgi:hypothetical protein
MRSSRLIVLVMLASLALLVVPSQLRSVQAQSFSKVYLTNSGGFPTNCCAAPGYLLKVSVLMDLASGETINGFDVRIDYSGWGQALCIVCARGTLGFINYTANVFADQSPSVLADAADGITLSSQANWPTDDSPSGGQFHLGETVISSVSGPLSGALLFNINFYVNGTGTSLFTIDRANLVNPGTLPLPNPHYLQVLTAAGVFSNTGIVPFFDFQPTIPPFILPGVPVAFDASEGFYGNSGHPIAGTSSNYTWFFGDGTLPELGGLMVQHTFVSAGNFTVVLKLNATSSGFALWNFTRTVPVSANLGALDFRVLDTNGSPATTATGLGVRVFLYNFSTFITPFANRTANPLGEVVFTGLAPGTEPCLPPLPAGSNSCRTYYFRILGPALVTEHTEQFQISPGWTSQERAYYAVVGIAPRNGIDTASIVYLSIIVGGIAIVGGVLFFQRRARREKAARRQRTGRNRRGP